MTLVGCTGGHHRDRTVGSIRSAATLWAAHLPGVLIQPLRLFPASMIGFSLHNWPGHGGTAPVMMLFADPFSTPMQSLSVIENNTPAPAPWADSPTARQDLGKIVFSSTSVYDRQLGVACQSATSPSDPSFPGLPALSATRFIVTKAEHNVIQSSEACRRYIATRPYV